MKLVGKGHLFRYNHTNMSMPAHCVYQMSYVCLIPWWLCVSLLTPAGRRRHEIVAMRIVPKMMSDIRGDGDNQ